MTDEIGSSRHIEANYLTVYFLRNKFVADVGSQRAFGTELLTGIRPCGVIRFSFVQGKDGWRSHSLGGVLWCTTSLRDGSERKE
jgi:hypothetical protein